MGTQDHVTDLQLSPDPSALVLASEHAGVGRQVAILGERVQRFLWESMVDGDSLQMAWRKVGGRMLAGA